VSAAQGKSRESRRARVPGAVLLFSVCSLSAALCMLPACGGGSPPKKGQRTVLLKTEVRDEKVGQEVSQSVGAQMGYVDNPELEAYVREVGRRLERYAPRGRFQYQFKVIDQEVPNAFGLPGGTIFVSRGLLAPTNSEDELAGVLSHEIIHVAARHAAARQAMIEAIPEMLRPFASGAFASYGRDQEREADRLGQGLAGLAGYDPSGLPKFLEQLNREEWLQLGRSRAAGFVDTHPATGERIASAASRAGRVAWERAPLIAGSREGFLHRIEGLVVGATGDRGVFHDELFLHPTLAFALRFPVGWLTQNTPQTVAAVSPKRDGIFFLRTGELAEGADAYAETFLEAPENRDFKVSEKKTVKISGIASVQLAGASDSARGSVETQITFIPFAGSMYILTGLSMGSAHYKAVFLEALRSFGPLTPDQREMIQELRLRIATARAGESLQDLSDRTGNVWDMQQTAVSNAIYTPDKLGAGELVKVAVPAQFGVNSEINSQIK